MPNRAPCVRCGGAPHVGPRQYTRLMEDEGRVYGAICMYYIKPAPRWMRALNRLLGAH